MNLISKYKNKNSPLSFSIFETEDGFKIKCILKETCVHYQGSEFIESQSGLGKIYSEDFCDISICFLEAAQKVHFSYYRMILIYLLKKIK